MGQTDSKSSDFSSFKATSKLDTPILGPVTLMLNPQTHYKIVFRELIFSNQRDFLKNEMLINERERLSHLNVLKVFKFETKEEKQLCSNFYKMSQGMEYFGRELSYEIEERRKRGFYFTEKEVEGFIRNMINGLGYLQEKGVSHGNVRTTTIFGENTVYKIIEPGFCKGNSNYTLIMSTLIDEKMNLEGVYMAPENLTLIQKKIHVSRVNPFKVDVFALGCIAMEMTTLKSSLALFNYKNLRVNLEEMRNRLKETQTKITNPIIFKMIESMVIIDVEKRPDFIGLINFKYEQPEPENILKPNVNLLNRVTMVKNFSKLEQRGLDGTPTPETENFSSSKKNIESLKKKKLVLDNNLLDQNMVFELPNKNESVKRSNKIFTKPMEEIKNIDEFMSAKVEKRLNFFDESNFDFKSENKKEEIKPIILEEGEKKEGTMIENLNMQAESNFTIDFSQLNDQNEKNETVNVSKDNSQTEIHFNDELPKFHIIEEVGFEKSIDLTKQEKTDKNEEAFEEKEEAEKALHNQEEVIPQKNQDFDDFSKFNFNFESCQPTENTFNIKDFNDFEKFSTNFHSQTPFPTPFPSFPQNKENGTQKKVQEVNDKIEEDQVIESPKKNKENIFYSFPNFGNFEIQQTSNGVVTPIFEDQTIKSSPFADGNINSKDFIELQDGETQNNENNNTIFDSNANKNNETNKISENFIYSDNYITFENVTNVEPNDFNLQEPTSKKDWFENSQKKQVAISLANVTSDEYFNEFKYEIKEVNFNSEKKELCKNTSQDQPENFELDNYVFSSPTSKKNVFENSQKKQVAISLANVTSDEYFNEFKYEIKEVNFNSEKKELCKNTSQDQPENFELDNYVFSSPTKIYMINPEVQKIIDSFKKRASEKNNLESNGESYPYQENENYSNFDNNFASQTWNENCYKSQNPTEQILDINPINFINEKFPNNDKVEFLKIDDNITNNERDLNFDKTSYNDNWLDTHKKLSQLFVLNPDNSLISVSETYQDSSIYTGTKKNGLRHGKGKFQYGDGGLYDGDWKEGQIEGEGTLYYADGYLAYEGEWKGNRFNGKGLLYNNCPEFKDLNYEDFSEIRNGWFKYEGSFVDDAQDGFGRMYFMNGDYFEGNFKNGAIHGNGRFYEKISEREYIGEWCFNYLMKS